MTDAKEGLAMGKLEGKIALITGGTSGIGAASAELMAAEGASVILAARNEEQGRKKEEEIVNAGGKARFFRCDVTQRDEVANLREYVLAGFGRLDILMNNAGVLRTAALEDITDEDWDTVYNTNLKSALYVCQTFIDLLQDSRGVILNNASINGLHHYIKGKRSYMYATSKSALIQFTKYLAKNYAPAVRVNCLCPGMTITNLFTNRDFSRFDDCNLLGRMAAPEEIGKIALFLVSDDSSFMTGSVVVADGGESLL